MCAGNQGHTEQRGKKHVGLGKGESPEEATFWERQAWDVKDKDNGRRLWC